MDANAVYGGNYLNAATLRSEKLIGKLLTIVEIRSEMFKEKDKLILSFKETGKELPLNKTNANVLISAYGAETDQWVGKHVRPLITKVLYQGQQVDGIQLVVEEATA